jgi:hypothetical protein
MAKREVSLVLLCEDTRHASCVRRFLVKVGYADRKIRAVPLTQGRGSAEQAVRESFAHELAACRRRRSMGHQAALVVVTDGDNQGVAGRLQQLGAVAPRVPADPVAILVPTWSIETWILHLRGESVDESQSYKQRCGRYDVGAVVDAAYQRWLRTRQSEPTECVPSLAAAAEELARLPGIAPPAALPPALV